MIQAEPKKGKSELLATNDFDDFTEIAVINENFGNSVMRCEKLINIFSKIYYQILPDYFHKWKLYRMPTEESSGEFLRRLERYK